jgi:hypothetical protein
LLGSLAEVITKQAKEDAALFADDTLLRVLVQGNEKTKASGISLGLIARVSVRSNTCQAIKPGCMWVAMPVSSVY